jgi:tetratricopeptide (TPR) repeat protein
MAFPKVTFQLVLVSLMSFFLACTEKKSAGNEKIEGNEPNSLSNYIDTVQNQQISPLKLSEEYASKGKIIEAIQVLSDGLINYPKNPAILYRLGNLYLQSGDTTKAINSIQQSIDIGNENPDAILKIGFLLANKNDPKCLKYAQLLIHENDTWKTNYQGYFLKGIYFANTGNKKEAMIALDKSIIENYRFIDAYIEKAILLYESNEFKKSIKLLQKGIEIDRFQADLYYWIGRNSEKLKDLNESIYAYEQTLTLAPDFENAKIRLDSIHKIKNK